MIPDLDLVVGIEVFGSFKSVLMLHKLIGANCTARHFSSESELNYSFWQHAQSSIYAHNYLRLRSQCQ